MIEWLLDLKVITGAIIGGALVAWFINREPNTTKGFVGEPEPSRATEVEAPNFD